MQFFPSFHPSILSIDSTLVTQFDKLPELFGLTIFSATNSARSLHNVHNIYFSVSELLLFTRLFLVSKTDKHSFNSQEPLSFCSFLLISSLIFLSIWKDFLVGDRICCSLGGTNFLPWLHFDEDCLTTTVNIIKTEGWWGLRYDSLAAFCPALTAPFLITSKPFCFRRYETRVSSGSSAKNLQILIRNWNCYHFLQNVVRFCNEIHYFF